MRCNGPRFQVLGSSGFSRFEVRGPGCAELRSQWMSPFVWYVEAVEIQRYDSTSNAQICAYDGHMILGLVHAVCNNGPHLVTAVLIRHVAARRLIIPVLISWLMLVAFENLRW